MRRLIFAALLTPLVAALSLSACGDDDLTGSGVDLSGSYELAEVTFLGQTVTPPEATGTATLTTNTYSFNVSIFVDPPGLVQIMDQGTYSASGDQWTRESSDTGTQATGTFSLTGTTLTVNTTLSGFQVEAVWERTS